jgi:acetolactate decarboxylase
MWKGQLYGTIALDTISNKQHLYGLGPLEFLSGEIMVIDGKSFVSSVVSDTEMTVVETYQAQAPFFVHTNVAQWKKQALPENIHNLQQLEQYLDEITQTAPRPFAFKLTGKVESAIIHIMNVPKGMKISSPDEAHRHQVKYKLEDEEVEIVGFFSTEHQAVFTHHDSFIHTHLMTTDQLKMGHLDEVLFKAGTVTLYLPDR